MKKFICITSVIAIALCAFTVYKNNAQTTKLNSQDPNGNQIVKDISQETMHTMDSVNDVITYSNTVVLGTVLDEFPIGNQVTKYTVLLDKTFKGNSSDKDIDVYEADGTLESGKQYLLFLGKHDSALFPRTNYTSILKDCIIEVNADKSLKNNKFVNDLNSMENYVSESETNGSLTYNELSSAAPVIEKYENIQELIQASEFILHVTVKDITIYHEYVSGVSVEVIGSYKGVIERTDFMLPTGKVEKGKEYFLFLKEGESNTVELAAREGSIISNSNSDIWNNTLKVLESIRQ